MDQSPRSLALSKMTASVAVVVPIFKHPGLLAETIASALKQQTTFPFVIILVNDGCPFKETDTVCREFAHRYREQIIYLRKKNGGLSSARNAGIDVALRAFPELEALYLLDADNLIQCMTLQRSFDLLKASTSNVGWIYPDIDKFGLREFAATGGRYSVLEHLCWNFCEAGSMTRASMLRRGMRYDESMQAGYEDWEFWIQCIAGGFVGRHLPSSGFRYRQRAESMLKDSERQHESIVSYIRAKHKALFSPASLLALEASECGRYALFCRDSDRIFLMTDSCEPARETNSGELGRAFGKALQYPGFLDLPSFCVLASENLVTLLRELKLLNGVLWRLQSYASATPATLEIRFETAELLEVSLIQSGQGARPAGMILVPTQRMIDDAQRPESEAELALDLTGATHFTLTLAVPFDPPTAMGLEGFYREVLSSLIKVAGQQSALGLHATDVQYQRRRLSAGGRYGYLLTEVNSVFPLRKMKGRRDIGMLLPVLAFGGVEKVCFAYARAAVEHGARVHFFIATQHRAFVGPDVMSLATTINFFWSPALEKYKPTLDGGDYLGAPAPLTTDPAEQDRAVGLLCLMDVVINFNVSGFNPIVARLRRLGVRTMTSQHLVDRTPFGQPQGTPHQILAYEHAYDDIIVISRQLRDWFASMGVPRAKLLLVENGPGFEISAERRDAILRARSERRRDALRVLFIGRFDRQKGLDRLCRVVERCLSVSLPIEWRVVGRAVLADDAIDMSVLEPFVVPATTDARVLAGHYGWADVLVLPSRFEGVPLSIIEAGNLGCIPVATRVGAVEELIVDGETGYLIGEEQGEQGIVGDFVERLKAFSVHPKILDIVSSKTASHFSQRDWASTTVRLIDKLCLTA